ncbi:CBN-SKR-20 protein [Caenorhabditis brenneri]|uniref:Skp1-related protein n=1 Tax=Caenorhabditis brenneri TaxID=135651 RepID=G0MBK6_CAEBE|nr:CBN-SKR-20 protein [Caenorhabditis brenneri]
MSVPLPRALYKLKSEDGQIFMVERIPMKYSSFINQKFIDLGINDRNCDKVDPILVPCHSSAFEKIIEWLYHHQHKYPSGLDCRYADLDDWDKEFFKMQSGELFELISATHSLGIKEMMNMGCSAAAQLINGKSTKEMREILGIRTDEERMELALANGGEGSSTTSFVVDKNFN